MRTKANDQNLAARKAFVWEEETPPSLIEALKGAQARRRFVRYWISDTIADLPKMVSYQAMRVLPIPLVSALGALHYGFIRRYYPGRNRRIAANVALIRPDLDPAEVQRAYWRNKGRLMAEFSVLPRIRPPGRITVEGVENLLAARAEGPVVLLGLHLGNWELTGPVLARLGIPAASFYMPPESRAEHRIVRRVRDNIGTVLLPPGVKGVRPAMKALSRRNGVIGIAADEGFDGRIMAPFFGRPAHASGNLAIAVRLARHAGAQIVPVYVTRHDGAHFTCHWLRPIALEAEPAPGTALAADVERLNAVIEPIVRAHVDQWHFLDHHL